MIYIYSFQFSGKLIFHVSPTSTLRCKRDGRLLSQRALLRVYGEIFGKMMFNYRDFQTKLSYSCSTVV